MAGAVEDEHVGGGPGDLPEGIRGRLDSQRVLPIRRIILHHTVTAPNLSWRQLSEIGRTRIYLPEGVPHSEHFDPQTGEETFVSYHFLVYQPGHNPDGEALVRRCLQDNEIGWHAGNWPVNCESVAFSFVGDYRTTAPTEAQLQAVAQIARGYDRAVDGQLLVQLHHEVSQVATACPARVAEARDRLIELLNERPPAGQPGAQPTGQPGAQSTSQPAPQPAPAPRPAPGALGSRPEQLHGVATVLFRERAPFAPGTALTDAWLAELAAGRFQGRPVTHELEVPGLPGARCQAFGGGVALWRPESGGRWLRAGAASAAEVTAVGEALFRERAPFAPGTALTDAWLAELAAGRFRGLPLSSEMDVEGRPGARCQVFEGGIAVWAPDAAVIWVAPAAGYPE
jgi:hypothetical protein